MKKIKLERRVLCFDQRVSVMHGSKPGTYSMCHGCRLPISETIKYHKNILRVSLVQNAMIN